MREVQDLWILRRELRVALQTEIVPLLKQGVPVRMARRVLSPYAGGISVASVQRIRVGQEHRTKAAEPLRVASLNPGRSGLTRLGSNELLIQRRWDITRGLLTYGF